MISLQKKFKNFGLLEILVSISIFYVVAMLIWTATTRNGVLEKANNIKSNHKNIVKFLNDQINICSQDLQKQTLWLEE